MDNSITSSTLLSYQPAYYQDSIVINNINNTNAIELNSLNTKIENVLNQFFANTADTSLERWEKDLGLEVINNYDTSYRRSKILSRLRGKGTTTIAMIKNVAESFQNGEVNVIEDNANYSFTIKFVGIKGIPPNIEDVYKSIEEIKPAHLAVNYEFRYATWNELSTYDESNLYKYTWGGLLNGELEGKIITMYTMLSDGTYKAIEFKIE